MRRFSDDAEKRKIVAQTRVSGVWMAQVARRYDVNANLIIKWLQDPRFSLVPVPVVDFLPVTVAFVPLGMKISHPPVPAATELSGEITTLGGCKVRVD